MMGEGQAPGSEGLPAGGWPLVSLIIVTWNSADQLPACFAALAATTYPRYQVLVVDNASHDGTRRYLAEQQPQARLLANSENVGFGRACNQGARAAAGDLLVFLNPDVLVMPDWLTILVRHMHDYPDAAILCPTTLYPGQPLRASATPVEEVAAVPGCALMVRRAAWRALGGFDEQMFLYWEDVELCWRAWLLGWRVLADLQAQVYHQRGGSTAGRRWDAEQVKNSLYTYLKLMRWRRIIPFAVVLAVKTAAKLALYRRPDVLGAWAWNVVHAPATLAARRRIRRQRRIAPARLEALIAAHRQRQASDRRERRVQNAATTS